MCCAQFLALVETPAFHKVIAVWSKAAFETAALNELAQCGFGTDRSLFAFTVSLPKADVVGELVRVAIEALLSLLGAPYLDPVLYEPFHHKGRFVSDTPDAVKHEHQQNIKLFLLCQFLGDLQLVPVFSPYLVAGNTFLLFLMDNHPAHLFAKGMTGFSLHGKHELYDLVVNETEAAVVRIIFDKYVHEGFGAQRIATYLNKQGYRARTGKMWHHASIRGIVCNLTYTGVLRCGESRSQELPHLQIISPELFEAAQHIRTSRANSAEQERHIPLNTRGNSLLAGNVYCGHCGARLSLTTNGKAYPCKEDPNRVVKRVRYVCYGKTRKQTDCDGQTGYTAHILDGIIDKLVRQIFERMKAIPKSDIVNIRYREKMEERKSLLHSVRAEYAKAAADLETLKGEVIKTIRGESTFSKELLSSLIAEAEAKCQELQENMETAQAAYDEGKTVLASLNAQYDDIISWAEMYDTASMEAKKMIVNCLIKRVDVYRDYKLHIDFNIDFEQFCGGLDIVTIAA